MKKFKKVTGNIYHVAGFHPDSSCVLTAGIAQAQGIGVYFSPEPRLIYSGGEVLKKKLRKIPVFCIDAEKIGKMKVISRRRDGQVSYIAYKCHLLLENIVAEEKIISGKECVVYTPKKVTPIPIWDLEGSVKQHSPFSRNVVYGKIGQEEALRECHKVLH